MLGATVGQNVRIYECRFINLQEGFNNLNLGDDIHIGSDCLIDLKGPVAIGRGTVLSPRVVLISHSDPGFAHESPIAQRYPPEKLGISIGKYCWIGSGATIISGSRIGDYTVIGAMALVREELIGNALYAGVPAHFIRLHDSGKRTHE